MVSRKPKTAQHVNEFLHLLRAFFVAETVVECGTKRAFLFAHERLVESACDDLAINAKTAHLRLFAIL